jgi:hypothetical protein
MAFYRGNKFMQRKGALEMKIKSDPDCEIGIDDIFLFNKLLIEYTITTSPAPSLL